MPDYIWGIRERAEDIIKVFSVSIWYSGCTIYGDRKTGGKVQRDQQASFWDMPSLRGLLVIQVEVSSGGLVSEPGFR